MKLALALCALVASCAAAPVAAVTAENGACMPTITAQTIIFLNWGERPVMMGDIDSFRSITVYVNPDAGTYTIMGNDGYGVSCIIATGWNFQYIPLPANT